ncbi:probable glycolipid transfer protein HET-C2 [Ramularia collo-cygni]|uniref:Probable glycolipid transfer protein HET-C2 n=1 Tax=Ramularia collo-cygni TaxID=112498 RepID=A0A2D3URF3_9PEZI|nr:probable glycolipid transfer protein HET-C2 [Ramularia collo-cygni]CZT19702.1 probable glycolipid transfer protein HET-C2 [Ramularia collo-cygni]
MAAYPPGGTYFDGKKSFNDVHIKDDEAIPTAEFLEAADAVTALFDVLGSTAFKPVKSDMTGNIQKVRTRQLESPVDSETLQDLVRNELKSKKHTATEGLLWLTRALDFTAQGLRHNLSNTNDELSVSFREAYGKTLKPHHSMFIKPIFSAAMSATPYRKDFYAKLADEPQQARVSKELDDWLVSLEKNVAILNRFLATKEAKW